MRLDEGDQLCQGAPGWGQFRTVFGNTRGTLEEGRLEL